MLYRWRNFFETIGYPSQEYSFPKLSSITNNNNNTNTPNSIQMLNQTTNSQILATNNNSNIEHSINHLINTIKCLPDLFDKKIDQKFNLKINDLQNRIIQSNSLQNITNNSNNLQNQINKSNIIDRDQSIAELSILIKKILKMDNNLNIVKSHINNGTTPKSLNHQNFPTPFLGHNESYVTQYNILIEQFQMDIMLFNMKEIENNKSIAMEKFKILRMKMQLSNVFPDLVKVIQSNFKKCEADLSIEFKKSDKKVKNAKNYPFLTKKVIFNDSYDTANYSSNSDDCVKIIDKQVNLNTENISNKPLNISTNKKTNEKNLNNLSLNNNNDIDGNVNSNNINNVNDNKNNNVNNNGNNNSNNNGNNDRNNINNKSGNNNNNYNNKPLYYHQKQNEYQNNYRRSRDTSTKYHNSYNNKNHYNPNRSHSFHRNNNYQSSRNRSSNRQFNSSSSNANNRNYLNNNHTNFTNSNNNRLNNNILNNNNANFMNSNSIHHNNNNNHTHQFKYTSHSNSDIPNNIHNNNHTVGYNSSYDNGVDLYQQQQQNFYHQPHLHQQR